MTIFVYQDEYIGVLTHNAGIKLAVHRQDVYPFMEEEGMEVGVGQKRDIKLTLVGTPHIFTWNSNHENDRKIFVK